MQTIDTSISEGAMQEGWVPFLNIKNKYFYDMDLWRIKNGVYQTNPDTGKSNLDIAIQNWTTLYPPESNFYIWASAKYTALEIIINAMFRIIFSYNLQISQLETKEERENAQKMIKNLEDNIKLLKQANKEITQLSQEVFKLAEEEKRLEQKAERAERATKRSRS